MSAAQPVFVDDTGRRRVVTRRVGRITLAVITAYLGLLVLGLARDPRLGPISLPTFGLPSLGLMSPPPPTVLGAEQSRTAAGEVDDEDNAQTAEAGQAPAQGRPTSKAGRRDSGPTTGPTTTTSGTAIFGPAVPGSPASGATSGTPAAAKPTTTTARPGQGPKSSTTTTTTTAPTGGGSTTTTTSTTSTTEPAPGRGQGQAPGAGPSSGKGPDGSGAPGQTRKTTTTTTAG